MKSPRKHHLPSEVFDQQNHIVSITACTADRDHWLAIPTLARIVQDEVLALHQNYPVIGYCIMPDHIHLLLCNSGTPPGKIMNGFKGRTSRSVRAQRAGLKVWQQGYWDHVVRKEEGLYSTLQYIFLNPVRADLVVNWWDYEWLGAPLLGSVGEDLFSCLSPEDIVWRDLVGGSG